MNTNPIQARVSLIGSYLMVGIVACASAILLFGPVVSIPARIVRNYNEGLTAYYTECVSAGCLYPPLNSLTTNVYPPLFYYVNVLAAPLVGDPITSGRVLALAGLLLTALNVGIIVSSLERARLLAAFTGLVFLGTMAASFRGGYVAMADPQWLAHGVMTTGLVMFLRARRRTGWLILSAVVMVLAGLIKHSLIPLPIAVTAWCLVYERDSCPGWIGASLGAVAVSVLLMFAAFGENAFIGILSSGREYSFNSSLVNLSEWILPGVAFCACALLLGDVIFRDRRAKLLYLYLLLSMVWGFLSCGVVGSNYNHVFDVYIALIALSGVAVARWAGMAGSVGFGRTERQILGMAAMALSLVLAAPREAARVPRYLSNLEQRERETAKDIAFISAHDGTVWCEFLPLCYWSGKPWSTDLFMAGQKMKAGQISQDAVIARISNHEISLIQLEEDEGQLTWLPDRVMAAIKAHYEVVRRSRTGGLFYAPKK